MSNIIYADGIGNITIIDGVARVELISVVQVDKEKVSGKPAGTLAMSLAGLVRAHQDLTRLVDKLVADGVLQRREAAPALVQAEAPSGPAN